MPRDPEAALEWLLEGNSTFIDLGRVGSRFFTLYATVGFHAAIFHGTNLALKRAVGRAAFCCRSCGGVPHKLSAPLRCGNDHRGPARRAMFTSRYSQGPEEQHQQTLGSGSRLSADHTPLPQELECEQRAAYTMVLSNFCNYAGFGALREGELCDSSFLQANLFESCSLWPSFSFTSPSNSLYC